MAVVDHFPRQDGNIEFHVRQLITTDQLDRLQAIERAILGKAMTEAKAEIDAALVGMSSEPSVQLPIAV
jgi:transcription termination factor NusB